MLALTPAVVWRLVIYVAVGILIALGIRSLRPSVPAENPAYDALVAALNRKMAGDSLSLDSARVALAKSSINAGRTIVRYRTARDTVLQHLTDTVRVKEYVARADSVVRSCSELLSVSSLYATRCDSAQASLRLDRDRWKLSAESLKPGRFDGFVRRALPVVAFVGGVYIGSRVTR